MDLEKELTKLEKYMKKQGREELVRELRNLDNEERRQRLMKQAVLEQEIADTKIKESEKPEIIEAKDTIKEFNATYREQLQMSKKISRLIHLLIEDSGKV
jgi:hypothetical protein